MNVAVQTSQYVAIPLSASVERAEVISKIMRSLCEFETIFTDYQVACERKCFECPQCWIALDVVSRMLTRADARVWEVWDTSEDDAKIVGILYLTSILPGADAQAHFAFFDRKLGDKTSLLEEMISWTFADHDDWRALQRLTIEIPDFAFALARYAHKKLGFGGDFIYKEVGVEGVRRSTIEWRGAMRDTLILGRLNN